MKNQETAGTVQSAYFLEYGRRKIKVCADTFLNLARIFSREDQEEAERDRTELLVKKSLSEGRRLFAKDLKEMADMLRSAAEEPIRFASLGGKRRKQLIKGLQTEGLQAEEICLVRRGEGRMELSALLSSRDGKTHTAEEAADYFSVLLDMRLTSSGRNPYFIGTAPVCCFFEEEPAYVYLTGSAGAIKERETVSGDCCAFFEAGDGNLTLLLSDGMGSGQDACRESAAVADMAEDFLETGMPPELAVRLINSVIVTGGGSALPTLDLCSVDLYEGRCRFLKTGAAVSFIKRGRAVEKISAASLPLGAFGQARTETAVREVSDGDYIVLLSDGMTQGWPREDGEAELERLLAGMEDVSPTEMARTLLQYAVKQQGGRIRDDMTVLTAGIWERERGD